jgi:Replication-relaxation
MSVNTFDVKLNRRIGANPNVEITKSTLEILRLILEFKLASACHIARFLNGQDQSRYIYRKLRLMWQAGLLESFKVFPGSIAGAVIYYMLSKQGLKLLAKQKSDGRAKLEKYPEPQTIMDWGLFKHEAQIVELASMESKNKSASLTLNFSGEQGSRSTDYKAGKTIEAISPDYIVTYKTPQNRQKIYTEFERTRKSNEAMLDKIQRYFDFLPPEDYQKSILRLIFQKPAMERNFWLNIFKFRAGLLRLKIMTTNLDLITGHKNFLEPIYASEDTVELIRGNNLKAIIPQRIKLFEPL